MFCLKLLLVTIAIAGTFGYPARKFKDVPPKPRFEGLFNENHDKRSVAKLINEWKPTDKQNAWELSGLYQGDIMLRASSKNGLIDEKTRWPLGIVPYYINEDDFTDEELDLIDKAIEAYHDLSCLRFRPYKKSDKDYVSVQGSSSGCWSSVGRVGEGQALNLQVPACVRHGTIIHEFLHAVGFYHQQSASNRDEYVIIHWENITPGLENNFDKYDNKTVTDYGVEYDYKSVMHYSTHAFSKNGKPTIESKKGKVELGQRKGFSEKDLLKLQMMYEGECKKRDEQEE